MLQHLKFNDKRAELKQNEQKSNESTQLLYLITSNRFEMNSIGFFNTVKGSVLLYFQGLRLIFAFK